MTTLDPTLAQVHDILELDWEPWDSKTWVGDLVGWLRYRRTATSEHSTDYPLLIIEHEDGGRLLGVHAFHTVLWQEVEKQDPQPGDAIGIRYKGRVTRQGAPDYESFSLAVIKVAASNGDGARHTGPPRPGSSAVTTAPEGAASSPGGAVQTANPLGASPGDAPGAAVSPGPSSGGSEPTGMRADPEATPAGPPSGDADPSSYVAHGEEGVPGSSSDPAGEGRPRSAPEPAGEDDPLPGLAIRVAAYFGSLERAVPKAQKIHPEWGIVTEADFTVEHLATICGDLGI